MERAECNRNCWILGAIAGVVVLLFTAGLGDLHWLAGLFLGAITCGLFGALLVWLVCHDRPDLFVDAPGGTGTGTDWQRATLDRQPEQLLVGGGSSPEDVRAAPQMPIVAGRLPGDTPRQAAAPDGQGDDLRRIKGIGPKIADWLSENGITRYAQIADWDQQAVADFGARLGRMGSRIEADDWVGQARQLAAGGDTAFSHRVDDGEVY